MRVFASRMENSADHDLMASREASRSGSTMNSKMIDRGSAG